MNIKEHEQIVLNDFNAQLQVIRNNINISNAELEKALKLTDDSKKELKLAEEEIARKNKEFETFKTDKMSVFLVRENNLKNLEEDLKKRIELFNTTSEIKLNDIKLSEQVVGESVIAKRAEVGSLSSEIILLEEKLKSVSSSNTEAVELSKELGKVIRELTSEYESKKEELDNLNKQCINQESYLKTMMEDIQSEIDSEREKIMRPKDNLMAKEEEVAKREKNLKILIARYKKEFKKLYPEQEPNI